MINAIFDWYLCEKKRGYFFGKGRSHRGQLRDPVESSYLAAGISGAWVVPGRQVPHPKGRQVS
jgi:hypothetical protein